MFCAPIKANTVLLDSPRISSFRLRWGLRLQPGANATIRLDKANKNDSDRRTVLRLSLRVKYAIKRLVKTAEIDVAVTAWRARPSLTPRSRATGVSMPAGRNSAMIRPQTPIVRDQTAFQLGVLGSSSTQSTELHPVSGTTFFMLQDQLEVTFVSDASGVVSETEAAGLGAKRVDQ